MCDSSFFLLCPLLSFIVVHYARDCLYMLCDFFRYDNSTKEASFSVGLQGVRMGDVQKVKDMIWSTLENVARYVYVVSACMYTSVNMYVWYRS